MVDQQLIRRPAGRSRRVTAVAVMALLALACSPGGGFFGPGRSAACGAYAPPNEVLRTISLAAARDYRAGLPALGIQPELETDMPAVIVVFQGPMRDTEIRGGGVVARSSALKHVCIVLVDGSTHLYPNVDVSGLLPLPAAAPWASP